ncbi:MAG TPA: CHRD domain-containing protein [Gaiellaceae bacterium]|nr:CHRD domain-containing protein [Gaiellaceae bacterium]
MRLRLILLLAVIAVAVPAVALASHASSLTFGATLLGKSEVPKGAPAGKGTATITITGTKVCWKFTGVKGITKVTASHIHIGKAGTAGNVVVAFFAGSLKTTGCVKSTSAVVKGIEKNPKGYYVNIHTVKYPAGAIRGQLHAM